METKNSHVHYVTIHAHEKAIILNIFLPVNIKKISQVTIWVHLVTQLLAKNANFVKKNLKHAQDYGNIPSHVFQ
jgi:hypothetical protein